VSGRALKTGRVGILLQELAVKLRQILDKRLATIEIENEDGHSMFGKSFHREAFADTSICKKMRLGLEPGAKKMSLAK